LCELLGGRDPDLAPAAGHALDALTATLLDPRKLERIDRSAEDLRQGAECLHAVWNDRSVRADLRAVALRTQAQLGLLPEEEAAR
jgi:hypothetical protein